MNKRLVIGIVSAGVILLGAAGSSTNHSKLGEVSEPVAQTKPGISTTPPPAEPVAKPVCDGTTITNDCTVDGVTYKTYVYHPAIAEKSHVETTTTYEKKVTGYCTLCVDGTYSPSCATGRGACSYHGGVQEWNAPRYSETPVANNKMVIDAPAQAEYYDKITL